jgi:hypothetical protein
MAGKTLSFSNIFWSNARVTIGSTRDPAGKSRAPFSEIFLCFDSAQKLMRDCASNSNSGASASFIDHSARGPDARNRASPAQGN